jgi:hypothetical protein
LKEAESVANDLLEEVRGGRALGSGRRNRDIRRLRQKLRDLATRSPTSAADPVAEKAAELLGEIETRENELRELEIARDRARGAAKTEERAKKRTREAQYAAADAEETAAKKAEHAAGKSGEAATKAEKSAAKTTVKAETAAAKTTIRGEGAAATALVKAEETAIKAEAKIGYRVAAGAGRLGLSLLLPGPEDAIILLALYGGSYEEAWDIIEQRNTRSGIAMGIAAGMMGLDWEWVHKNLWRRFATRDVATEVIGAVGKAERSYNDGLVRGHKYGAGHPLRTKKRILAEAFTTLAQEGYETDEEGLFTIDTVARVAGVLMPIADDFLRQAAEHKQAREKREEEQRRKEAKEWGSVGNKA